ARSRGNAFLLANGRAAAVDPASALARERHLVVAEISGSAAQGRIVLAAPITPDEITMQFSERIITRDEVTFDAASASLRARRRPRLGALVLAEETLAVAPNDAAAVILADGIVALGLERLPWTKALRQWRDRVMFLRRAAPAEGWPDLSDAALAATAKEW